MGNAFAALIPYIHAFSQRKHPFTFEDMMKLRRVGELEVSPNGSDGRHGMRAAFDVG